MEAAISCVNLGKQYVGKTALKNINLQLEKGKIYGLLGPNGSGKTTLMKIISDLHRQSSGEILVMDQKPSWETHKFVSYMPTENFVYEWMTVENAAQFYRDMYADFEYDRVMNLINFMELDLKQKVSKLSSGQKSRLKISLALSRRVPVYLLDEPLNGLDPISRAKIKEVIVDQFSDDGLMVICTHLVNEIEPILDEVILMKEGEIIMKDEVETLKTKYNKSIEDIYREVF